MEPKWLEWAKQLQALAQNGLNYSDDPFEIQRCESIMNIAAEIMAAHTDHTVEAVCARFDLEDGPATPKVDVRGAVFRDDKIFLVRERGEGEWTVPGGWAEVGEPPSAAIEREIYEESGYKARAVKLLAFYDRNKHGHPLYPFHVYKVFFLCELVGGEPTLSAETDDVGFFGEDEIPTLSLTRVMPAQIMRLFEHYRNPDWPTEFD